MNANTKKLALVAAVVLIAVAGWYWLGRDGGGEGKDSAYTTQPVTRGNLVARVTATGTLSARVTVQVGSQVSGRIAELAADFNTVVKKGQVIAKLDPQLIQANVEQSQANLSAAQSNLSKAQTLAKDAKRQAVRAAELRDQKLLSAAEADTTQANAESAEASVVAAQAEVAQARAALNQAKVNLDYTVITSPINGVVISRSVDVGQTVAASLQAPTLFTIAEDLKTMQVHTNVAESDVGKLEEGMPVSFTVDAYPSERFRGKIAQVRNSPQVLQNVVTYDAVIDVDNADLRLKPGMTANVNFVYAKRENALLIPNAALRYRPSNELQRSKGAAGGSGQRRGEGPANQRNLWVLRDGAPVAVQVETGVSDGAQTEIIGGELKEGDALITDSASKDKPRTPQMRMF